MAIDTWAKLINYEYSRKYNLVEIEPAVIQTGWTAVTGKNYLTVTWTAKQFSDGDVSYIKVDDTALTRATDLDNCNVTASTFWLEDGELFINEDITSKTVLVYFWLYFSDQPGVNLQPARLSRQQYYYPIVKSVPAFKSELASTFFTNTSISDGTVELFNGDRLFDTVYVTYLWNYKTLRILTGGEQLPYAEYKVWQWWIKETEKSHNVLTLKCNDIISFLDKKIPPDSYSTDDYANLETNADGRSIPLCFGTCTNIKPTMIDTTTWRFKLAGHRIKDIVTVREDGVDITTNIDTEYLTDGEFTLSAYAGGEITCDVEGWYDGTNYPESYKDIFNILMTTYAGLAAADIDSGSLDDLATYKLGVYVDKPVKLNSVLNKMNESILCFHGKTRAGKIAVKKIQVQDTTEIVTIDEKLETGKLTEKILSANLYSKIKIGWFKNYTVQSRVTLATGIRADWSFDYKWIEQEVAATKYKYDCEDERVIDTYLTDETQAGTVAGLYSVLFKEPWMEVECESKIKPYVLELMDTVKITTDRINKQYYKVSSINEDRTNFLSKLKLIHILE